VARMIPTVVGDETSSEGERSLFKRFKQEPGTEGWVILHSLDIPRHRRQVMGEIDFVIAVPGTGVLCLEVKAHRSVRRGPDGLWHLGRDDKPTRVGPFRQASDGMHSLRNFVTSRAPDLAGTLFWSAVCFTHVPFTLSAPAEWHEWQVIDSGALSARPLAQLVTGVLERARQHVSASPTAGWFREGDGAPTDAQVETLTRILRPSFEFFESPKSRRRQRDDELRRYTEEQYNALEAMELNERVVFEGAAGTGKTLLALEETRRATERGERVLLCCFNNLLGKWLKRETEPFGSATTTSTFHGLLLSLTGLRVPADAGQDFWDRELPNAAIDQLLQGDHAPFDLLVIDEAQDLLRGNFLDIFELLLKGGLKGGRWRMFGDFEQQSIYGQSPLAVTTFVTEHAPASTRFALKKNCRNTPRIASFVKLLAAYERGYADVMRPDNGVEPETIYWDSPEDQDVKLLELLNQLFAEGYSGQEIVILSPRAEGCAAKRVSDPVWRNRIREAQAGDQGGPRYCTVHLFKGLEAPVVIVSDVNSIGSEADASLFYTAITRATDRLFVLASSHLKPTVVGLLLRQLSSGGQT
jgi:hypothetical protein